jgi:hypothetical protein
VVRKARCFAYHLVEPSFKASDLLLGERARGNVAFEVPISAHGFILKYETPFDTPIKIDLGL